MEYKNVHIIYFSPTHTSAKTAYAIAEGLNGDVLLESDITYDAPAEGLEIHDDELTIVAAPVYGGRVAETAMERLRAFHAHQAPVVPVVVYGNRDYEDALKELSDTLVDAGFVPVSAGAFIGEHSFSRKDMPIAAGRPDDADHEAAVSFRTCHQGEARKGGRTFLSEAVGDERKFPLQGERAFHAAGSCDG